MLRLLLLRWKRNGLRRERARLHQMAAGIRWELDRNDREAVELEKQIAELVELRRSARFSRRFKVAK